MRALLIIAFIVFGLMLGFGLGHWSASGYSQTWQELPHPPAQVIDLLPAGSNLINIQTMDGAVYRLSGQNNAAWVEAAPDQDSSNSDAVDVREPCDLSSSEFTFLSNPPRDIQDCLQVNVNYADGYSRYAFVLDGGGQVWQWQLTRSPYMALVEQICFPGLGLVMGSLIGFPVAFLSKRKKRLRD